jgi:predicted outer membrane protein
MAPKYKAVIDRLSALSGADFDRAFLKELVHYQDSDLKLLQDEAANGTIDPLRKWASRGVPGLERRIEAAREEHANLTVAEK